MMKSAGFEVNAPNGLIISEKVSKDKAKEDDLSKNTFSTATTNSGTLGTFFLFNSSAKENLLFCTLDLEWSDSWEILIIKPRSMNLSICLKFSV